MEQYKVRIFPTVQQDLLDVIDYLNTLSPDTSLKYYDRLTNEIIPEEAEVVRLIFSLYERGWGVKKHLPIPEQSKHSFVTRTGAGKSRLISVDVRS